MPMYGDADDAGSEGKNTQSDFAGAQPLRLLVDDLDVMVAVDEVAGKDEAPPRRLKGGERVAQRAVYTMLSAGMYEDDVGRGLCPGRAVAVAQAPTSSK